MRWSLVINKQGVIDIPPDLWELLRQRTGRKSKKRRHVKKAVRKLFMKIIRERLDRE